MRRAAMFRSLTTREGFTSRARLVVEAWESGYVAEMDTTALGWAVQRTGAGREKAGEPVDPHAGILFHARRGARVERGQPFATIYATNAEMLAEPAELIRKRRCDCPGVRRGRVTLVGRSSPAKMPRSFSRCMAVKSVIRARGKVNSWLRNRRDCRRVEYVAHD